MFWIPLLKPVLLLALVQLLPYSHSQSSDLDPQIPSDLKQCSNVELTWQATPNNGSSQMYYASIVSASSTGLNGTDEVVTYLTRLNDTTSYQWQVGVPTGSDISLRISDAAGNTGYSPAVTVQEGDSSCMPINQNDRNSSPNVVSPATASSKGRRICVVQQAVATLIVMAWACAIRI